MTSSRLPGKVMMQHKNKPMIMHLIERLQKVNSLDDIVIATTINHEDDAIVSFEKENIKFLGVAKIM